MKWNLSIGKVRYMVPGQVVTREIIDFMLKLDVKEIHGYNKDAGLKIIKPEVLKTLKK